MSSVVVAASDVVSVVSSVHSPTLMRSYFTNPSTSGATCVSISPERVRANCLKSVLFVSAYELMHVSSYVIVTFT